MRQVCVVVLYNGNTTLPTRDGKRASNERLSINSQEKKTPTFASPASDNGNSEPGSRGGLRKSPTLSSHGYIHPYSGRTSRPHRQPYVRCRMLRPGRPLPLAILRDHDSCDGEGGGSWTSGGGVAAASAGNGCSGSRRRGGLVAVCWRGSGSRRYGFWVRVFVACSVKLAAPTFCFCPVLFRVIQ